MSEYSAAALKDLLRSAGRLDETEIAAKCPRGGYSNNQERALRAVSWIEAADKSDSADLRLICSLIAFEALHVVPEVDLKAGQESRGRLFEFLGDIAKLDRGQGGILLSYLTSDRRGRDAFDGIMENIYLHAGYWKELDIGSKGSLQDMERRRRSVGKKMREHLNRGELVRPLDEAIKCVRVLRNQMMHGDAGYGDYYNREQVGDCAHFMLAIAARMTKIMIDNFGRDWGRVPHPPQGSDPGDVAPPKTL